MPASATQHQLRLNSNASPSDADSMLPAVDKCSKNATVIDRMMLKAQVLYYWRCSVCICWHVSQECEKQSVGSDIAAAVRDQSAAYRYNFF